jgi:hypothetical protein
MSHAQGLVIALIAIVAAKHYDLIDTVGFWMLWFVVMWDLYEHRPSRKVKR